MSGVNVQEYMISDLDLVDSAEAKMSLGLKRFGEPASFVSGVKCYQTASSARRPLTL